MGYKKYTIEDLRNLQQKYMRCIFFRSCEGDAREYKRLLKKVESELESRGESQYGEN